MIRGVRAGYRQLSGFSLNMFTEDELAELHRAILEVLEDSGLMVFTDEAQEIFYSYGCKVDRKSKVVKIPSYMVEEAIESAPSQVLLAGRNPKNDYIMGGKRVGFTNFGEGIKTLDLETGKLRDSIKKDVAESALLCDALDNVDVYFSAVTARDVPTATVTLHVAEAFLNNTSKHCMHIEVLNTWGARKYIEMGRAVMGSAEELRRRPIISAAIGAVSPLQLSHETCEVVIEFARAGIPLWIGSEVMGGATAPVTFGGALVVQGAEYLGSLTLSQLTQKGAPVIIGGSSHIMDLKVVSAPVGSPEYAMMNAAAAQMAHYYNLPCVVGGA